MRRLRLPFGFARAALALIAAPILCAGAEPALPPDQPAPGAPRLLASADLGSELRALIGPTTVIFVRDRQFIVIDHAWLVEAFLPHFRRFLTSLGPQTGLTEGLDCDNYADLLRTQLVIANLRGGGHRWGDVACAVVQAYTQHPFGDVPATKVLHALIALRTSQGWFVIEPQNTTLSPLSEYPNLESTLIASLE